MRDQYATVADMVRDAERHADDMSKDRLRATEYYRGEMKDTPYEVGRSSVTTRDVRATIKKVLPSIMRTILSGDKVVEYMPANAGDEEYSEQATDYVNHVIVPETDMAQAIKDAVHDALLLRNGILKWWFDERQCVKISKHSGLPEDAFAELAGDPEVEVLEHTARMELVETPEGMEEEIEVHDLKIRRSFRDAKVMVAAVPRERFLIHPDAITLEASILVGEKTRLTRSDLVAMGHDRETVEGLAKGSDDDYEETARRDFVADGTESDPANQEVDYYDVFVRVDEDDDGIAELRHMCFAGGIGEKYLLLDEECDEVQFCDITAQSQPHQWEGVALSDDLMDIQQNKTVLLRLSIDNLLWQNNQQPIVQEGVIRNKDAVYTPEFGKPIRVAQGTDVRAAFGFAQVPFTASQSFAMLEYLDSEASDRTGVSDASGGLAPDALQNVTAKASAMIEQAGIGQTEMMVRTIADGLRVLFRGVLKLVVRHQDVPRTVRLRDEWVTFDPRQWNADMDCQVNVGLGAGTRERDLLVMQQIMGVQERLLAGFGPDNPFVKPANVYAAVARTVESAGLKTPALYFTEPDEQEVAAKLEAMRNQPAPEQMKMQAQMQMDQAKLQGQMQLEQAKMQSSQAKEQAQMQADLQVKRAEIEADSMRQADKLTADAALEQQKAQLRREEMAQDRELALAKMEQDRELEILKLRAANGEIIVGTEMDAVMVSLGQLADAVRAMAENASRPKRVVRDENGDVIGVESIAPARMN